MDVEIRKETSEDFQAVFALNKLAFGQDSEARLVDLLRKSDAFIPELSLVATEKDEVVGYILFSKIGIKKDKNQKFESLALAPMAVKPSLQNKGIGGRLIRFGLDMARKLGFKSVIVLGHENYYPRFGFVPTIRWNIKTSFNVPQNVLMGIELEPGALSGVSGIIEYPAAFEQV